MTKKRDWIDDGAQFDNPFAALKDSAKQGGFDIDKNKIEASQNALAQKPIKPETLDISKAKIRIERKGRGGKEVTIVTCNDWGDAEYKAWLSWAKKRFGVGGSLCEDGVLLQGDLRNNIREIINSNK
ncbi:MAG: translation initiation factor [Bradymonadia bacterium]|jgi:translation initiation factor 1